MKIDIIEPVGRAIQTTRRILFSPFDFVKWCGMGFTAMLGADFFTFSGVNSLPAGDDDGGSGLAGLVETALEYRIQIALAVAAVLALGVAMLWIRSRGQFMFLDNLARNAGEIREPWRRLQPLGNSLFRFMLAMVAAGLVCLMALALVSVLVAMPDIRRHIFGLNSAGAIAIGALGLGLIILAWGVVSLLTEDFVVPVMYAANSGVIQAWHELLELLRPNKGAFALYVLFRLLLESGVRALAMLLCAATCCIALLPFAGTVLRLPLLVFRRAYPLSVLEQFGGRYRLLPAEWPAPPTIPGPASRAPGPT